MVAAAGRRRGLSASRSSGSPRRRRCRSGARGRRRAPSRRPSPPARRSSRSFRSRCIGSRLLVGVVGRIVRILDEVGLPARASTARARRARAAPCGAPSLRPPTRPGASAATARARRGTRPEAGKERHRRARTRSPPHLPCAGNPGGSGSRRARDFRRSARRSPGTSATTGASSQTKTSDLTICVEAAPDRVGSRLGGGSADSELLEPGLGARAAQERGHPLDRLRPRVHEASLALAKDEDVARPTISRAGSPGEDFPPAVLVPDRIDEANLVSRRRRSPRVRTRGQPGAVSRARERFSIARVACTPRRRGSGRIDAVPRPVPSAPRERQEHR